MGAVDTPQPSGGGKGKKKRRVGIRIDMTPLVDVAFLLLIFFMVTTVFRTPQALEINLPPKDNPPVPIAKSNILTVFALPGDRYKWNVGEVPPEEISFSQLPGIMKQERDKNPNKIVVVIKVHPDAKFHAMVDIIDELDVLKMTRFALAPMTEEDKKEVAGP
ncbi:MAG: ExbD/TolR family protein [Candidatus Eiseniibacteriota bacterium]